MTINLNQPRTVIFHPGIGKTATSKIQTIGLNLASNNAENLCFSPFGIFGGAHNLFSSIHPNYNKNDFDKSWSEFLDFASQRQASTVISSEFLIRDRPQHIKYLIQSVKERSMDVKVVVSIREYSEYLMSAFLQAVKVNWGIKRGENFIDYSNREIEHIRYTKLVDNWSAYCGDENIYILDYSKNKATFVSDFFNILGVDIGDLKELNKKVNLSIPFEIAPIIRHFDQISNSKELREKLLDLFVGHNFKGDFKSEKLEILSSKVVRNKYLHDVERLKSRYQWVL